MRAERPVGDEDRESGREQHPVRDERGGEDVLRDGEGLAAHGLFRHQRSVAHPHPARQPPMGGTGSPSAQGWRLSPRRTASASRWGSHGEADEVEVGRGDGADRGAVVVVVRRNGAAAGGPPSRHVEALPQLEVVADHDGDLRVEVGDAHAGTMIPIDGPGREGGLPARARRWRAAAGRPSAPRRYALMQMNLCLSGLAGCYGKAAYPAVLEEATARIRAGAPRRGDPQRGLPGRRRADRPPDRLPHALLEGPLPRRAPPVRAPGRPRALRRRRAHQGADRARRATRPSRPRPASSAGDGCA